MLNENIKALRKEKRFTQEELASRLNITRQTVSKWEKGYSVPDADTLILLAEILDADIGDLIGKDISPDEIDSIEHRLTAISSELAKVKSHQRKTHGVAAFICTVLAYLLGLWLDIIFEEGFFDFKILFPLITMGLFILLDGKADDE